ncbi:hypothetical protein I4U23_007588 [Adineta vaga]|nr:hypothetical protein I4U23_007588 [Adineta vaga]
MGDDKNCCYNLKSSHLRRSPSKYFLIDNLSVYLDLSHSSSIETTDENNLTITTDNDIIIRINLSIYLGYRCQYRSQRVSLTVRISTAMQWREVFAIVFSLVDSNETEQNEYLGIRDCHTKFNINLLYVNRPKDLQSTNDSIIINAFMKNSKTIKHPMSCISVQSNNLLVLKSNCTRECEPNSCCFGKLCICLLDKVGSRCLLSHSICFSNPCRNSGTCVPTDLRITKRSFYCICQIGFSGHQCQIIDTRIDIFFEKHINITITKQPFIIRISIMIAIIMFRISFTSSILSLITFRSKLLLTIECHYYLLSSTITCLFIMIIFNLKFFLLIIFQMGLITYRTFLLIHCISIDFFLRIFLNMNDWLHTCVSIERVITVIEGISFNQPKSRQIVKWIIVSLTLLPRLIISLLPDCMETIRNPWLRLITYWFSFIPSMVIFPIFILPSNIYRNAFKDAVRHLVFKRMCQR